MGSLFSLRTIIEKFQSNVKLEKFEARVKFSMDPVRNPHDERTVKMRARKVTYDRQEAIIFQFYGVSSSESIKE